MNKTLPILLCLSLCLPLAGCGTEEAPVMDTTVTVETAAVETGDLSSQSTYIAPSPPRAPPASSPRSPAPWRRSPSPWGIRWRPGPPLPL